VCAAKTGGVPPFYLPAATATHLRPWVLKEGDTLGVFDDCGHIQAAAPAVEGLFLEDTRYLSRLAFVIEGRAPLLLSSSVNNENTLFQIDQTNPDLADGERPWLPRNSVFIRNSITLGADALYADLALTNFGAVSARFQLELGFAADFADMFELRGTKRNRRGEYLPVETRPEGPALAYRGLDGVTRRACFAFDPVPESAAADRAAWRIDLAPGASRAIRIELRCERDGRSSRRRSRAESEAATARRIAERHEHAAALATTGEAASEWLDRSRADLDMLVTETPQGPYPYAGIPWFATEFGRDGLIAALACLWLDPTIAAGVLKFLAANQAKDIDPRSEAEPGKILHEMRLGEMAALGEVPFGHYYGSVDATPLFVVLAAAYYRRTGDLVLIRALWPNLEAALAWMTDYGDRDGDGFLEYGRRSENGLVNQGWKDSGDAIFHRDGSLAEAPIALVEVQAYAYAAYRGAAELARALDRADRAATLEAAAAALKSRFESMFWSDALGTYVLALDRDKRRCEVRASNAGHVLFGGLATPEQARRTADTLMSDAFFSGWGIRTVAEGEPRYNPISYHNGSIWPHDNALIAIGLGHYGFKAPVLRVMTGLFDAARVMPLRRQAPTAYPVACSPQAWSSTSVFAILGAAIGISFDAPARRISFKEPVLPPWLPELHLSNLRLGNASLDLVLTRNEDKVSLHLGRCDGQIEIEGT
jgi:glycogen debranching enzyme